MPSDHVTEHPELGPTAWYALRHGDRESPRGAWEHTTLPAHAAIIHLTSGQAALRIEFAAPSPLGLLTAVLAVDTHA